MRRYVPGHGFKSHDGIPSPDDTGWQLSFDGRRLYVSQWYNKRIVALGGDGSAETIATVPHGRCGQDFVDDGFYLVTTDDEESDDYWLTRCVPDGGATHVRTSSASAFRRGRSRSTAKRFWTNHREGSWRSPSPANRSAASGRLLKVASASPQHSNAASASSRCSVFDAVLVMAAKKLVSETTFFSGHIIRVVANARTLSAAPVCV